MSKWKNVFLGILAFLLLLPLYVGVAFIAIVLLPFDLLAFRLSRYAFYFGYHPYYRFSLQYQLFKQIYSMNFRVLATKFEETPVFRIDSSNEVIDIVSMERMDLAYDAEGFLIVSTKHIHDDDPHELSFLFFEHYFTKISKPNEDRLYRIILVTKSGQERTDSFLPSSTDKEIHQFMSLKQFTSFVKGIRSSLS
jgi:hypothetical protein